LPRNGFRRIVQTPGGIAMIYDVKETMPFRG